MRVLLGIKKLNKVFIPDTVTRIEDKAFDGCKLKSIMLPNGIEYIGSMAFQSNPLADIILPSKIKKIESGAFAYTYIKEVNLPSELEEIAVDAFPHYWANGGLEKITVDQNNRNYTSIDGVLYNKDKTYLVLYPSNRGGEVLSVPDGVNTIGKHAFDSCKNLKNITFPDTLKDVEEEALYNCSIAQLLLPQNLQRIANKSFSGSFKEVEIPASVIQIEGCPFVSRELEKITVAEDNPNYITEEGGLYNKDKTILLQAINQKGFFCVPNTVVIVGKNAFSSFAYEYNDYESNEVFLPSSVQKIEKGAFAGSHIDKIIIPSSIIEIEGGLKETFYSYYLGGDGYFAPTFYGVPGSFIEEEIKKQNLEEQSYAAWYGKAVFHAIAWDDVHNITAELSEDMQNEGIVFVVQDTTPEENKNLIASFGKNMLAAYHITLQKDGVETQPDFSTKVSLPVPEGIDGSVYHVYRKEADGSYTDMNAEYSGGRLNFRTDHFSIYVVSNQATTPQVQPLKSISLDKTTMKLEIGRSETLTVTYNPADTTDDKKVEWSTSNDKVATVKDGKVTGVSEGTATITAKVGDKTAACKVTVKQQLPPEDNSCASSDSAKQVTVKQQLPPEELSISYMFKTSAGRR